MSLSGFPTPAGGKNDIESTYLPYSWKLVASFYKKTCNYKVNLTVFSYEFL